MSRSAFEKPSPFDRCSRTSSPSSSSTRRPRVRSSSTTISAIVLLPAPESPVNQTQQPGLLDPWRRRIREAPAGLRAVVRSRRGRHRVGRSRHEILVTLDSDLSGPRDACGVFGIYAPGQQVSHSTYLGLYALQHRGQESAGISVSDGETITVVKDMGLVTQVFDERRLAPLEGHLAIGHVRYSTTGSSTWRNAQPVYRSRRRRRLLARPQRQPHEHRSARRRARHAAGRAHLRQRADRRAARARVHRRRSAPTVAISSTRSNRCCRGSPARSRSC